MRTSGGAIPSSARCLPHLLFVVGKALIAAYLQRANLSSGWGAATGSLIAVLAWLYYSSLIVLFGAELTQVWARRGGRQIEPADGAVRAVSVKRIDRPSNVSAASA